jgi:hypothetical protein
VWISCHEAMTSPYVSGSPRTLNQMSQMPPNVSQFVQMPPCNDRCSLSIVSASSMMTDSYTLPSMRTQAVLMVHLLPSSASQHSVIRMCSERMLANSARFSSSDAMSSRRILVLTNFPVHTSSSFWRVYLPKEASLISHVPSKLIAQRTRLSNSKTSSLAYSMYWPTFWRPQLALWCKWEWFGDSRELDHPASIRRASRSTELARILAQAGAS